MNFTACNLLLGKFVEMEPTNIEGYFDTCGDYFNNHFTVGSVPYDRVRFHESWDWLMPIVEKIESLQPKDNNTPQFNVNIKKYSCEIQDMYKNELGKPDFLNLEFDYYNKKILAVYNACVKFIKWYNLNKDKYE